MHESPEWRQLSAHADKVAREFIAGTYRTVREFDVTLARNAILDCLHSSEEPDFIARMAQDKSPRRSDAHRVFRKIAPHLIELCGKVLHD